MTHYTSVLFRFVFYNETPHHPLTPSSERRGMEEAAPLLTKEGVRGGCSKELLGTAYYDTLVIPARERSGWDFQPGFGHFSASPLFRMWPQRWGTEAADKSRKWWHGPTMTSSRE
jgi:hypothetical protein